jgi:hypothetical protein
MRLNGWGRAENASTAFGVAVSPPSSSLERPRDLIAQRLHEIGHHGVPEPVTLGRTAAARLREALADDKG